MVDRRSLMEAWVTDNLGLADIELEAASLDVSFRRYWRVRQPGGSLIVMDAPPEQEDCGRFVRIAGEWRAFGLNTPELAQDLERGFLLLGRSGEEQLYLDALDAEQG